MFDPRPGTDDFKRLERAFRRHARQGNVPFGEYLKQTHISFGERLSSRAPIYLDTKFWLILRDTQLGRRKDSPSKDLLRVLSNLVDDELAFCPISESTFMEVMQQTDETTRNVSCELIDKLSMGASLIGYHERILREFEHFLCFKAGLRLRPLKHYVWTRLGYVLGYFVIDDPMFTGPSKLTVQKCFFDEMWNIRLTDLIALGSDLEAPKIDFSDAAKSLNLSNSQFASEIRSFRQVYIDELLGCLDPYADHAGHVAGRILAEYGKLPPGDLSKHETVLGSQTIAALKQTLRTREEAIRLPTLHILASLHAAVRWDKNRKLKSNDFLDFHHAAGALAYCDAFLTENSLRTLLNSKHLELRSNFPCKVFSSPAKAAEFLRTLRPT